ncbi:hypothetical protein BH23GEM10_BH23GEM10_04310 [soil metagenome]
MRRAGVVAAGLLQCGAALFFATAARAQDRAQDPTVHIVRITAAGGGAALARAVAGAGDRATRIELAPGRYVLEPTSYTDPSCGNCEDASETVPTTLGLRVAGRIEIRGAHADSVIIETRAGYGLLFEDCTHCMLSSVTVTGGVRSPDGRATDAGVLVRRGTVRLTDCVIRDNIGDSATVAATVVGIAGIAVREHGVAGVHGCRIVRNSWDGIALYRDAQATIADNVIDGVDKASGARVGGGRGVGIGLTWNAEARVHRNLVRRYWKGIGVFVDAWADIEHNIVEDILTWGIALWGPDGAQPSAQIEQNVIYRTGACGVMIDRPAGGRAPGRLVDNVIMQTGGNDVYDSGEPYCWQRPIARHNVPADFVEHGNRLVSNRQPVDAGSAGPPLPELGPDSVQHALAEAVARLQQWPALRAAFFFDAVGSRASALRPNAAEWEALVEAEDARAPDEASLRVLLDGTRSAEPELRLVAVRALGRLERTELIDAIGAALRDPDARVRAVAANALAQAAPVDARVRTLLLEAIPTGDEEPTVVAAVAESLGRLQHADAAAAREVLNALRPHLSGTQETRLGVLRGLYFAARQPRARAAFDAELRAALAAQLFRSTWTSANNERARVVAMATIVAAGAQDPAVFDSVLCTDASAYVRREAVAGAGALADTAAAARLLRIGLADSSAVVQIDALRGWNRLAATHGCAPIIDAAASPHRHVRLLVYDALGEACRADAGAVPALRQAVDAAEASDAARALVALAAAEPSAARERLPRFAEHDDLFVRMMAARAAAALQDESWLLRFARDAHANVRTIAVQALARTAGAGATDVYIAQLASNESELLMAAAAALEGSSRADAVRALLDALDRVSAARRETSRDGRIALLERVRELGSPADAARLRPYLTDFDPAVARHAAETLSTWTGAPVTAAAQRLPREPLPTFEEAAALEDARITIELDGGDVVTIRLLPFDAPANAYRFARLARDGWFDGLTLHRVVPNFVVQGGSPGANEYTGAGAFSRDELGLSNANWRGTVGLSTRGRDTGDAQLFINLIDNVRLDHEYTVFGVVVSGFDALQDLREGVVIRRITVE